MACSIHSLRSWISSSVRRPCLTGGNSPVAIMLYNSRLLSDRYTAPSSIDCNQQTDGASRYWIRSCGDQWRLLATRAGGANRGTGGGPLSRACFTIAEPPSASTSRPAHSGSCRRRRARFGACRLSPISGCLTRVVRRLEQSPKRGPTWGTHFPRASV